MNAEKIGQLIKMLSSTNEDEVVAAARAILRTLAQEGTDIHELAERVEGRKLYGLRCRGSTTRRSPTAGRAWRLRRTSATSAVRPSMRWRARSNTRPTAGCLRRNRTSSMTWSAGVPAANRRKSRQNGCSQSTAKSDDADGREAAKAKVAERRPGQPAAGAGTAVSATALGALAVGTTTREVDQAAIHADRSQRQERRSKYVERLRRGARCRAPRQRQRRRNRVHVARNRPDLRRPRSLPRPVRAAKRLGGGVA
jgi:hypothetical protein